MVLLGLCGRLMLLRTLRRIYELDSPLVHMLMHVGACSEEKMWC